MACSAELIGLSASAAAHPAPPGSRGWSSNQARILATGSTYPFPANIDVDDRATGIAKINTAREDLAEAAGVLLLGAGPVGLELAGEITAMWPDKDRDDRRPRRRYRVRRLPGRVPRGAAPPARRAGVELVLGTSLREEPPSEPGEATTFTATTQSGREITADIWFRCFGVTPVTDYLAGNLAAARQATGHVTVTAELRLPGQDHVFAVGDLTDLPEAKMAGAAAEHADVVATNIKTLINGGGTLSTYEPARRASPCHWAGPAARPTHPTSACWTPNRRHRSRART